MSALLDAVKVDVADLQAKYKAAIADGSLSVDEAFALLVQAVVDAVKLVENIPGATPSDKKAAVLEVLDALLEACFAQLPATGVQGLLLHTVVAPAVEQTVHYLAGSLIDKVVELLTKEGVLKTGTAAAA